MNKVGRLLFLHFEKALLAVFAAGLLYSIVFHGPWRRGEDFNARLAAAVEKINSLPVRTGEEVPDDPKLVEMLQTAYRSAPALPALEAPYIWKIKDRPNTDFMPPTNVAAAGDRGYISVTWEQNPNAVNVAAIKPLGVEIERATVAADGTNGPFQSVTRSANGRFYTPGELYAIAQRYAPQATVLQRKTASGSAANEGYTLADLFNALHDRRITEATMKRVVREQVKKGWMSSEDYMALIETLREIPMIIRMNRRETRFDPAAAAEAQAKPRTAQENYTLALEALGYTGGGKYAGGDASQGAGTVAGKAAPEAAGPPVTFDSIATFIDADVSPDQDYVYNVRFWTSNAADPTPMPKATEWAPATAAAAAKPDTDFLLSGISAEQGTASVLVRKWIPSTKTWATQTYVVSPGQEIGRVETRLDGGKTTEVDFRTECVLLGLRRRPRSFERQVTQVKTDPVTLEKSSVDKVELWLYDTPQIVYSDRRGRLRVKWQSQAETG